MRRMWNLTTDSGPGQELFCCVFFYYYYYLFVCFSHQYYKGMISNKMMLFEVLLHYIPIFKKGDTKYWSNNRTITLTSMQVKICSRWYSKGFYLIWSKRCQMFKLDSEKVKALRLNCHHLLDTGVFQRISEDDSLYFTDYSKAFFIKFFMVQKKELACLSTWLSWWVTCIVDGKPLSGQNVERPKVPTGQVYQTRVHFISLCV